MGKVNMKRANGKGRQDKFYHLAKETGFRARSAFKLVQLDRKYEFLKEAKVCIDLCAAPGSWMQIAVRNMPKGSLIVGVDLVPIKPVPGAIAVQADITTDKCRQLLKRELKHLKACVVLNDGAPNVGLSWNQDAFTQSGLVLMSLKLATEWLRPGGTFVTKVFRSRDYNKLLYILNRFFTRVQATKPQSSRNVSAEIFVVCQGYLAPAKIDPRLLDPKHVFSEVEEAVSQRVNLLDPAAKVRRREGYEEGNVTLHKSGTVSAFLASENYLDMLAENNELVWGPDDDSVRAHSSTTDEVVELMKDLKVLGKKDFKLLIKWRGGIRDWLAAEAKRENGEDEDDSDDNGEEGEGQAGGDPEVDEQAELETAVEEAKEARQREAKRLRRKKDKERMKARERQALQMDMPLDIDDVIQDSTLFSMKTITSKSGLGAVDEAEWTGDEDEAGVALPAKAREALDREEHADEVEAELDAQYEEYRERKGMKKKSVRLKTRTKVFGEAVDPNEDAPETDYLPDALPPVEDDGDVDSALMSAGSSNSNPLIMTRDDPAAAESTAALWFSQSQFANMMDDDEEEESEEDEDDGEGGRKRGRGTTAARVGAGKRRTAGGNGVGDGAAELDVEDMDDEALLDIPGEGDEDDSDSDDSEDDDHGEAAPGFEEVAASARAPAPSTRQNLDAHGLALAAEMILRKRKREILDGAYNRYAFNDPALPDWFGDEEVAHKKKNIPMTKEMAADIKAREREINARPIKKVLEAKARKKRRIGRELEKLKSKATAITESEELTDREKTQQIQALYKKAKVGDKHEKPTFVRAKKGGKMPARPAGGGKMKVVDKRFKSDLAGKKRLEWRKKRGRKK
eukprot:m.168094 g.168094  ORF g.168094 m.168094 type:complete len:854 (+) comp12916_c0_seq1:163-2724(+)